MTVLFKSAKTTAPTREHMCAGILHSFTSLQVLYSAGNHIELEDRTREHLNI